MDPEALERLVKVETKVDGVERRIDALNGQIVGVNTSIRDVGLKVDTIINNQRLAAGIAEAIEDRGDRTLTKRQRTAAGVVALFAIATPIVSLVVQH